MSIRIRSGWHSPASVTPVSAVVAVTAVCPADSSRKVDSFMFAALSSTMSMVDMSGHRLPPGHGAPNLADKPLTVEARFPHHRGDKAVEPLALLRCDRLRGEDDDGD